MDKTIAFIGAGKMATAIIKGLLGSSLFDKNHIIASEPNKDYAHKIEQELGIKMVHNNREAAAQADIILLAVKPFVVKDVLTEIEDRIDDSKLIITIAAGISTNRVEEILEKTKVSHIDSHVHVHAIPGIFRIACKLAKEYAIKNIRTQFEIPYLVPDISKYISFKYPINLIKVALLNSFTLINWRCAKEFGLSTNENLIGVNYTGYMDNKTIEFALKNVKSLTELLLHPSISSEKSSGYKEFLAVADTSLNERLKTADITAVGWK